MRGLSDSSSLGSLELLHSAHRTSLRVGQCSALLPKGHQYLTHRCRLLRGVEALAFQGIVYDPQAQAKLCNFKQDLLLDLSGNAFETSCALASTIALLMGLSHGSFQACTGSPCTSVFSNSSSVPDFESTSNTSESDTADTLWPGAANESWA